tara:strand:- start:47641 stop:47802 length:162 start_codon:yes stop_codon:yes gene_type:complete
LRIKRLCLLLWNISLHYQFLDEKATHKIKVYDFLDQVVDTRRITADDFCVAYR